MKLFAKSPGKDKDLETVWPEDSEAASTWDTVNNAIPTDTASALEGQELNTHETILRDIFAAVTSCNISITSLTSEIKVKLELNLIRQDMQKLRDRTAALEDRIGNVENDVAPLQRELQITDHPMTC